jgi:hypothetical protein
MAGVHNVSHIEMDRGSVLGMGNIFSLLHIIDSAMKRLSELS